MSFFDANFFAFIVLVSYVKFEIFVFIFLAGLIVFSICNAGLLMSLEGVAPHFIVALCANYCFVSVFFHDAALVRSVNTF